MEPVEATIHLQVLSLLGNICRRTGSIEREIIERQAAMCESTDKSWVTQARQILTRYKLPPLSHLLKSPPKKLEWKRTTKKAVRTYWEKKLKDEAANMTSLHHLNLDICSLREPHPVWGKNTTNPHEVKKSTVQAQLLTGRYPLYGHKVSGRNRSNVCPLCSRDSETTEHFLLQCEALI